MCWYADTRLLLVLATGRRVVAVGWNISIELMVTHDGTARGWPEGVGQWEAAISTHNFEPPTGG